MARKSACFICSQNIRTEPTDLSSFNTEAASGINDAQKVALAGGNLSEAIALRGADAGLGIWSRYGIMVLKFTS